MKYGISLRVMQIKILILAMSNHKPQLERKGPDSVKALKKLVCRHFQESMLQIGYLGKSLTCFILIGRVKGCQYLA